MGAHAHTSNSAPSQRPPPPFGRKRGMCAHLRSRGRDFACTSLPPNRGIKNNPLPKRGSACRAAYASGVDCTAPAPRTLFGWIVPANILSDPPPPSATAPSARAQTTHTFPHRLGYHFTGPTLQWCVTAQPRENDYCTSQLGVDAPRAYRVTTRAPADTNYTQNGAVQAVWVCTYTSGITLMGFSTGQFRVRPNRQVMRKS